MTKTIFEEMGGTYTQVGDYLLPDLKLPEEDQQPIGVWGQRHWRYLKEHRRATYATLLRAASDQGEDNLRPAYKYRPFPQKLSLSLSVPTFHNLYFCALCAGFAFAAVPYLLPV